MDLAGALLNSAVTMAVPLLLAALGELVVERAGIINVGLEGMILTGAFAAMVTVSFSGSPLVGVVAAVVSGAALGALFGFAVVRHNASQVVAGVALNLLAVGITGVAYRAVFGVTGAALTIDGMAPVVVPGLSQLPVIGRALFAQTALGYLAFALVPACALVLSGSVPGLVLRMVGENPHAAAAQGVSVTRVRMLAVLACGALAGLSGGYLAVVYARTFIEGMSAGRGFIALAIVIFGRWSPWGILAAALLFGLATALQFHFQALALPIPYQFFLMLPYVATLLALAISAGHTRAPAALGQPYLHE
ncbi:MAG: ABC transporter permease [Deltaproteobacteria bacterium]|nr:ABC transporter permease [Deltaproteobacteria bacterium]MBI3389785.1 ABC transporter permease [Deltaproteobacteria bacterium]